MACKALEGMAWHEWFSSEYNTNEEFEVMLAPTWDTIGVLHIAYEDGSENYAPIASLNDPRSYPSDGATYFADNGFATPVSTEGGEP